MQWKYHDLSNLDLPWLEKLETLYRKKSVHVWYHALESSLAEKYNISIYVFSNIKMSKIKVIEKNRCT